MKVEYKKLSADALVPVRATGGSAGYDLFAAETVVIDPSNVKPVATGIAIAIPFGYEGQVRSRSGLSMRGIVAANSPGTIDSDYRGELKVILRNGGNNAYLVEKGDRIAQIVFAKLPDVVWQQVDELENTDRGHGGFGSTGE